MKRGIGCAAMCSLLLVLGVHTSIACGDKFLVRFASLAKSRVTLMSKPWAILVYIDPNDKAAENGLGKDMLHALNGVGLIVRTANSKEEFEGAIKNDVFDAVLVGYSATQGVEKTLREAGRKAKIVPIVDAENETEKNLAKERYGNIIKDTDRTSTKLLMLSEVLQEADKK